MKGKLSDPDRAAIDSLLADPALPPEKRWPLQFGLAQVLDALADFRRAAGLSLEANALQAADFWKRGLGYEPLVHEKFIDRAHRGVHARAFRDARGFGSDSQRPVFIVGLPRSGTSLTEQILASHPFVFGAGETRLGA